MDSDTLYQHSDNKFNVGVLSGVDESTIAASTFSSASYIIADRRGNVLIHKSLGDGVTVDGELFLVSLDDSEMTFYGDCEHQFSVVDSGGNVLPPVFQRDVKVKRVILNAAG